MPITQSAKKALRQNARRKTINDRLKKAFKDAVKNFKKSPSSDALSLAYQKLDKAAKNLTIHANRAGRLKSRLSQLLNAKSKSAAS